MEESWGSEGLTDMTLLGERGVSPFESLRFPSLAVCTFSQAASA